MALPRFELKYRVSNATALAVRSYVSGFLELDRFVTDHASLSYPVDSIYLDSPDLTTFWSTVNAVKCRYKLRVRTYSDHPDAPVFFEIKRRINACIVKDRGAVHRPAVEGLLAGRMPMPDDMASGDRSHLHAVEHFVRLMLEIEAAPRARVRYQREAWVSRDQPGLRLTMDRDVCVTPAFVPPADTHDVHAPARPFGETVVLEMKFSGRGPAWFRDLEQVAGLQRSSAAKYCDGILTRGVDHFSPSFPQPMDARRFYQAEARRDRLAASPSLPVPSAAFA
jgi:hypothetical protein